MKKSIYTLLILLILPALSWGAESQVPEVDLSVEISRLDHVISNKVREITFNRAEIMALEISEKPVIQRDSEREKLQLSSDVLNSEIEDINDQKAKLMERVLESRKHHRAQLTIN